MPKPTLENAHKYLTARQVAEKLGLSRYQLLLRIERQILPQPTEMDESGVRYFDDEWVGMARAMLK